MISVKLQLYKHKTLKDGRHPVTIQIFRHGKRSVINLKHSAFIDEWSYKNNRFKNSKKVLDHERKNNELERYYLKAQRVVNDFILQGEVITTQKVKALLFGEKKDQGFVEYVDELVEDMFDANEVGNAQVYRNVRNSFAKFAGHNVQFSDITPKKLKKYKNHLKNNQLASSTIHNYLRTIRSSFNKAIQDGVVSIELYPFKNQFNPQGFSLSGIKVEPNHRALNPHELSQLLSFDTYKYPHLLESYQLYLFMFLCRGMNWADVCLLQKKNITNGRIEYYRKKTKKKYSIKISPPMENIMQLFDCPRYVFPMLNERHQTELQKKNRIKRCMKKINKELKTIAMIVGIESDSFTTYSARHTYAMTMRRSGQPDEIISQALGHSDLATTKHYLESFENKVVDEADSVISSLF